MSLETDVTTVYVGIGNSDNKLTQQEWHQFCTDTLRYIEFAASRFLGQWHSLPNAPWQNAEYAAEVSDERMDSLRAELRALRDKFRQDSIAFAVVAETEFL